MARVYDAKREIAAIYNEWKEHLEPLNCSVEYQKVDGTWVGDLRVVESRIVGGMFDKTTGDYLSDNAFAPRVRVQFYPEQFDIIFKDQHERVNEVAAAQRVGKSTLATGVAMKTAIDFPGCNIFWVLPTIGKNEIVLEKLQPFKPLIAHSDSKHHKYVLINGTVLRFFSAESSHGKGESILGHEAKLVIIEEFREMSQKSTEWGKTAGKQIFQNAYSRIISTDGKVWIISSPESPHFMQALWEGTDPDFKEPVGKFNISLLCNLFIKTNAANPNEHIEATKRTYSPKKYKQDVLGQFVASGGLDYGCFDSARHVVNRLTAPNITDLAHETEIILGRYPEWYDPKIKPSVRWTALPIPLFLAMDFGSQTHALFAHLTHPHKDRYSLLDANIEVTAELAADEGQLLDDFLTKKIDPMFCGKLKPVVICDPCGKNKDPAYGQSCVDTLKKHGYSIVWAETRGKRKRIGIESVNSLFHRNRLFIHATCGQLIESLASMKSEGESQHSISVNKYSHYCDCLRYLVYELIPIERVTHHPDYLGVRTDDEHYQQAA